MKKKSRESTKILKELKSFIGCSYTLCVNAPRFLILYLERENKGETSQSDFFFFFLILTVSTKSTQYSHWFHNFEVEIAN